MVASEVEQLIRKLALYNAARHDGEARPGPVISGVLGDHPELKKEMGAVAPEIHRIINEINILPFEKQKEALLEIDPTALDAKEPNTDLFKDVDIEDGEDVVTCFPPGPEKYPHLGHATAIVVNYELAKRYNGKFLLRFEDTNPDTVKKEYYEGMLEDFSWLGVSWDEVIYASDHVEDMYEAGRKLIEKGKAYVTSASSDVISAARRGTRTIPGRHEAVETNLERFQALIEDGGDAVVLLKGDLSAKNSTLRDPALFRVNTSPHPRTGSQYTLWPTYDFQTSFLDAKYGVTHRLRSKEFEMRTELHQHLQKLLGYEPTYYYAFARFTVKGFLTSGRKIREQLASGELNGWDDPRLLTLRALRRRGIQPQAIRAFVTSTGLTKTESTHPVDELYQANKEALGELRTVEASKQKSDKCPKEVQILRPNGRYQQAYIEDTSVSEGEIVYLSGIGIARVDDNTGETFCYAH